MDPAMIEFIQTGEYFPRA